jgi:cobalamin biosynthesis protein CobD/CbiB
VTPEVAVPLSPDEQRILDEIEERLRAEDPRLAETVGSGSLQGHVARRIRLASVTFLVGFLTLMAFPVSIWIAAVGFGVMLAAMLVIYRSLTQLGRDQLRALQRSGGLSLPALLARLAGRDRRDAS